MTESKFRYSEWLYSGTTDTPREVRTQQYVGDQTVEFYDEDWDHLEDRLRKRLLDQLRLEAKAQGVRLFQESVRYLQPSYQPAHKRWVVVVVGWGYPA